jgi:hypothetical protein
VRRKRTIGEPGSSAFVAYTLGIVVRTSEADDRRDLQRQFRDAVTTK